MLAAKIAKVPVSFDQRAQTLSSLCLSAGLYGVEVSFVSQSLLRRFESAILQALWGTSRAMRTKEIIFSILVPGHRTSPTMAAAYNRVLWLIKWVRTPGPQRAVIHQIWQRQQRFVPLGPVGYTLRMLHSFSWIDTEGW